jgi:hypothetical protein
LQRSLFLVCGFAKVGVEAEIADGQVECETLKWANSYNSERLHSAIGYVTPQEAKEAFYANMNNLDKVA